MSARVEIIVAEAQVGHRLDKIIAEHVSVGSRRRAREALQSGKVDLDGHHAAEADGGRLLTLGQKVVIDWNRRGSGLEHQKGRDGLEQANLKVLYEDQALIVVDKPAGLLTDSATRDQAMEDDTARKRLLQYLRPQGALAITVHRLDRDTSGVILFAKTKAAGEDLSRQFLGHTPIRRYNALVTGIPGHAYQGLWEDTMFWDSRSRIQKACTPEHPEAAKARATATVLDDLIGGALVEVELDTGRRNQIRLQSSLRGHPLVGERLYTGKVTPIPAPRQMLHAAYLEVRHPDTGEALAIECPWAPDFVRAHRQLREGQAPKPPPKFRGGKRR